MEEEKCVIHLKSVGSAPIMKNDKVTLKKGKSIAAIYNYVNKKLKGELEKGQKILLQVSESFIPSQQTLLADLYDAFKTESNVIIISISIDEPGWG